MGTIRFGSIETFITYLTIVAIGIAGGRSPGLGS